MVGEFPKTNMGSERTRHSQIDQRWDIAALNTVNGGSCSGGEAANTSANISYDLDESSYRFGAYRLRLLWVRHRRYRLHLLFIKSYWKFYEEDVSQEPEFYTYSQLMVWPLLI